MHIRNVISGLLQSLDDQPKVPFPQRGKPIDAAAKQGVYVIRDSKGNVMHVGRTNGGEKGLKGRIQGHLNAASSFVNQELNGDGSLLRNGYTFQCIVVDEEIEGISANRARALLENIATAWYCPKHLGDGG